MAEPVDTLREHLAAVVAIGRRMPDGVAGITTADDADLVALLPAVQALVRTGQGVLALAAGEIHARDGGPKEPSLARRLGQRNGASLVAARAAPRSARRDGWSMSAESSAASPAPKRNWHPSPRPSSPGSCP